MDISNLKSGTEIKRGELSIVRKLGEGYSGVVYLAHDEIRNQNIALKLLKKTEKGYELWAKRFKEEYKKQLIGKKFSHISEIYQFNQFQGFLYFTSEYVSDTNIFRACRGLPINKALDLFIQMFEGLDFIHRNGVLHLDIKAENVLVKTEDGEPVVKIVDFGLAVETSQEIQIAGTPLYVAPEVVLGQKEKIGTRSDLFSAAVLMYYCLTTTFPFCDRWSAGNLKDVAKKLADELPPEPLTKFRRDVPEYLNSIVLRLLSTDPDERFYPNARAVLNSLLTSSSESFGMGVLQSYLRPIGNKHIGRTDMQAALKSKLAAISNTQNTKQSSDSATFMITGNFGLGKTHLLERLKEEAAVSPESLYVSAISFPADDLAIEYWESELQREFSDNKRAVLILADDVHDCGPEGKAGTVLYNVINTISDQKKNFDLYGGIKPIMLVMAGEPFGNGQDILKEDEKNEERYDWMKIARNGSAVFWEIKPFSKSDILEYLKSTPALKDKEISEEWLNYLMWITSGFPADVSAHLEERDAWKMLFSLDGSLFTPYTIAPNIDEPSMNTTGLKWMPLPAKKRLLKQYSNMEPLEREIVNLISVWNHRNIARAITEDNIISFFYSQAIKQAICNLADKGVIRYGLSVDSTPADSRSVNLAHPYMQSVIYGQLSQEDREAIHDTIAAFLKSDANGILLHKGYGSDKQRAMKSLIKLIHKNMYIDGKLTLAIALVNDVLRLIENKLPKLNIYLISLLVEANQLSGNNSKNILLFGEAFLKADKFSHVLKTNMALKYIKTLLLERKFKETRSLISDLRPYYDEKHPFHVKLTNYEARSYLDESFTDSDKKEELLGQAEKLYKKTAACFEDIVQNNDLGDVLLMKGDYKSARQVLIGRLEAAKHKHIFNYISLLLSLAETDIRLGLYDEAAEKAEKAERVAKNIKQWRWLMHANRISAVILYYKKDFKKAIEFDDRAFAMFSVGDVGEEKKEMLCNLYIHRGHSLKELKKFNLAIANFEAAVGSGLKGFSLMSAYEGLGESNFYLKNFEGAKKYLALAEDLLGSVPPDLVSIYKNQIDKIKSELPV